MRAQDEEPALNWEATGRERAATDVMGDKGKESDGRRSCQQVLVLVRW